MKFTVKKPRIRRELAYSAKEVERYNFSKLQLTALSELLQPRFYNEVVELLWSIMTPTKQVDYFWFITKLCNKGYSLAMRKTIVNLIDKDNKIIWI